LDGRHGAERHQQLKQQHDVVIAGSTSIVPRLMGQDLVDEYRLLVFALVLGESARLFQDKPIELELISTEPAGPAVLLTYRRANPA